MVDTERAVHIWIIDEAFPADCRTGFFKVDSHDDVQVGFSFFGIGAKEFGIFDGCVDVVNGAGAAQNVRFLVIRD